MPCCHFPSFDELRSCDRVNVCSAANDTSILKDRLSKAPLDPLEDSKVFRVSFPFSKLKARLSCCLRLSKTRGSSSPFEGLKAFAFPFQATRTPLRPSKTSRASLSLFPSTRLVLAAVFAFSDSWFLFAVRRLQGFTFPFPSYQ